MRVIFHSSDDSRFLELLKGFEYEYRLILPEMMWQRENTVTYCNDDGLHESWIDHILCTSEISWRVSHMYDLFLSNHFQLFCILECSNSSILVNEYTSRH